MHNAIDKIAQCLAYYARLSINIRQRRFYRRRGHCTKIKHMRNGIPNLGALQAFEATARLGSFSRAAEELSLTLSALYRQVTGLEDRLGVQRLTSVRRRVPVTAAGAGRSEERR